VDRVPVGPSTLALITAATGGAAAFVVAWAETGSAPAWLAVVSAALVAILGVLRSWQAVHMGQQPVDVVDEGPVLPDDVPASDVPEGV
jgi:hypothetical protein